MNHALRLALLVLAASVSGCASVSRATDRCTSALYKEASASSFLISTFFLPLTPICIMGNVVANNTAADDRAAIIGAAAAVGSVHGIKQGQRGAQRDAALYSTMKLAAEREASTLRGEQTHWERARIEGKACSIRAKAIEHSVLNFDIFSRWLIEPDPKKCADGCSGTFTYILDVVGTDGIGHPDGSVVGVVVWESDDGAPVEADGEVSVPKCARSSVRVKECRVRGSSYRRHTCSLTD